MTGRVIQGFFIGGRMCAPVGAARPVTVQRAAATGSAPGLRWGAPPPAFVAHAPAVQTRLAPGRPPMVHHVSTSVAQRFGGSESFEIDPAAIGLARGGGKPLPQALLAKMEAAFGADFSAVRVHVGPQASRIGAIAFTTGNDLYFAPGQFQPDSVKGQQLIGHELAHVVQQRAGRVRASGSGVAVVQDRMLEAEADRLGMRAAAHVPVQLKRADGAHHVRPGAARALQRAKANDDDDEYNPYKKQRRGTFGSGQPQEVIEATAHLKKLKNIDTSKYNNVWTCRACGRPLAYETKNGAFHLTKYGYISKNNNKKSQRALELDHHPKPWAKVLAHLPKNISDDDFREAYRDPDNLRALCRVCNGNHAYEGIEVADYDSDDSDGPGHPSTPKHEPENKGQWSFYKV